MDKINIEFTKLDKKNEVVEVTFFLQDIKMAKLKVDYIKDKMEIIGDLYNFIGWENTEEDKEKFNGFIEAYKLMGKKLLDKME